LQQDAESSKDCFGLAGSWGSLDQRDPFLLEAQGDGLVLRLVVELGQFLVQFFGNDEHLADVLFVILRSDQDLFEARLEAVESAECLVLSLN
jgi:hypothetical protein